MSHIGRIAGSVNIECH